MDSTTTIDLNGTAQKQQMIVRTDHLKPIPLAISVLCICIASLIGAGVITFSASWLATALITTASVVAATALFLAIFDLRLPSIRSMFQAIKGISSPSSQPHAPSSPNSTSSGYIESSTTPTTSSSSSNSSLDGVVPVVPQTAKSSRHAQYAFNMSAATKDPLLNEPDDDNDDSAPPSTSNSTANKAIPAEVEPATLSRVIQHDQGSSSSSSSSAIASSSTPAEKATKPKSSIGPQNIEEFYRTGKATNMNQQGSSAFTLNDFLNSNMKKIDINDYLPWVFPLKVAPQGKEKVVPVLDDETVETFKIDAELYAQVEKSFKAMLAYYGLTLTANGKIEKAANYDKRTSEVLEIKFPPNKTKIIANKEKHYLCMAHMIRSLALLGHAQHSKAFFAFLDSEYQKHETYMGTPYITAENYANWKRAHDESVS